MSRLTTMLENTILIDQFPYLGLFLLLILGTLGLPFPEDGILFLSGFLSAHGAIKPFPAFFVIYIGVLTTDLMIYSAGRRYGRRVIEHKRFRKILTSDRLDKLENKLKKWSILVVFLGRFLSGLRTEIFLVAGVMRVSWKKFLMIDAASALLTITLWGGLGYWCEYQFQILRRGVADIKKMVIVILVILIGGALLFWFFKKRSKTN